MEIIAGDIGGTKSWLVWARVSVGQVQIRFEHVYASADFASAEKLMQQFLEDVRSPCSPDAVCLALPGPVQEGQPVRLTNLNWVLEHTHLQALLNTPRLLLVNDFQAAAAGVATLTPQDCVVLNPAVGSLSFPTVRVITGAGTGLGLAWMQADRNGHYHLFATEGGHADFAPANAQQERLLAFMRQRFDHVSWERVLSGPGVNHVYQFCLRDLSGGIPPELAQRNGAEVNRAAQAGDPIAVAAMTLFAALYGNWVGNVALMYQPRGGIYLAGGISARIQPWLRSPAFLQACFDKGRMSDLVRQMPIYLITNTRLGLQGALAMAQDTTSTL